MLRIYNDPSFLKHETGTWHPESPGRMQAVMKTTEAIPGAQLVNQCPLAEREEIELIHTAGYYDYIVNLEKDKLVMLDPDTAFSPGSWEASLKAVGAVIEAVKFSCDSADNRSFCTVRPPGHHAEPERAMGFCIFNNIAVGAAYAIANKLAEKIAIIDWDVHHGNGTQSAFYSNPNVMYISLHQYPFYPGTGNASEIGNGKGEGCTINIPMGAGSGDTEYRQAFNKIILPAIDNFKPDLIMISAGFDAYEHDQLAAINLSKEFFEEMTKIAVDMAKKHCLGKIVSVLEGGYDLKALTELVKVHLEVLNEE